jgi:rubrerythrin
MDIASILLAAALILLVALLIARPLIERAGLGERQPTQAEALAAERETVVAALRELDFDHTTGKIAEEDYSVQRAALVAQGVALLKQLDEISPQSPAQTLDDELEAAIRTAREKISEKISKEPSVSRPETLRCPQCGQPHQADDRFCSKCGATLAAPTQAH